MGMVVYLVTLNEAKAKAFFKDSATLSDWLFSEEMYDSPDQLDLDKSWHGLHYLLTQTAWESNTLQGQAIMGGDYFGEDLGMGPAKMIMPDKVQLISEALAPLTHDDLKKNFNKKDMAQKEIYPDIWTRDETDKELLEDFLLPYFDALKQHYTKAAQNGHAIISYLT